MDIRPTELLHHARRFFKAETDPAARADRRPKSKRPPSAAVFVRSADIYFFVTWREISPPLFFSVWILKYHLPARDRRPGVGQRRLALSVIAPSPLPAPRAGNWLGIGGPWKCAIVAGR